MNKLNKITKIETQKKRNNRVSIFIDGKFAFGIYKRTKRKMALEVGDVVDEVTREKILATDEYAQCLNSAYHILSYKDRTEKELLDKLLKKEYLKRTISQVIEQLKTDDYLNDERYAKQYVESQRKKMGKFKLKYKLSKKGVDENLIEKAFEDYPKDYDYNQAYKLAKKRNERYEDISYRKRYQRVGGFLKRRGYSYDIIRSILEDLLDEYKNY